VLGEPVRPLLFLILLTGFSKAPLSELYGRRPVFLVSYSVFTLFTLGTALVTNIEGMLVCRFLAGATGSSVLVTSAAIIGDVSLFFHLDLHPADGCWV
jgi:MFS family permease